MIARTCHCKKDIRDNKIVQPNVIDSPRMTTRKRVPVNENFINDSRMCVT